MRACQRRALPARTQPRDVKHPVSESGRRHQFGLSGAHSRLTLHPLLRARQAPELLAELLPWATSPELACRAVAEFFAAPGTGAPPLSHSAELAVWADHPRHCELKGNLTQGARVFTSPSAGMLGGYFPVLSGPVGPSAGWQGTLTFAGQGGPGSAVGVAHVPPGGTFNFRGSEPRGCLACNQHATCAALADRTLFRAANKTERAGGPDTLGPGTYTVFGAGSVAVLLRHAADTAAADGPGSGGEGQPPCLVLLTTTMPEAPEPKLAVCTGAQDDTVTFEGCRSLGVSSHMPACALGPPTARACCRRVPLRLPWLPCPLARLVRPRARRLPAQARHSQHQPREATAP